jgi:hypothetical protein
VRWAIHVGCSGERTGKMRQRLTDEQETGGADKMHRDGPFYSSVGRGWMGWMGWLDYARSLVCACTGIDGVASGCCDSLMWRQCAHVVVL